MEGSGIPDFVRNEGRRLMRNLLARMLRNKTVELPKRKHPNEPL